MKALAIGLFALESGFWKFMMTGADPDFKEPKVEVVAPTMISGREVAQKPTRTDVHSDELCLKAVTRLLALTD